MKEGSQWLDSGADSAATRGYSKRASVFSCQRQATSTTCSTSAAVVRPGNGVPWTSRGVEFPRRSSGRHRRGSRRGPLPRPTAPALSTAPMASRLASRPRMPSGRLTCPSPCRTSRGGVVLRSCDVGRLRRLGPLGAVDWRGRFSVSSTARLARLGEIYVWVQTPAAAPAGAATVEAIAAERSAVASVVGGGAEGLPTPWVMPTRASRSATTGVRSSGCRGSRRPRWQARSEARGEVVPDEMEYRWNTERLSEGSGSADRSRDGNVPFAGERRWSAWPDLNWRPLVPQTSALTRLRHTPTVQRAF